MSNALIVRLASIYSEAPHPDERLWDYVDQEYWETEHCNVVEVNPQEVALWLTPRGDTTISEAFDYAADPDRRDLVDYYKGEGLAEALNGYLVIDLGGKRLVDGWHRIIALASLGVTSVKALDVTSPLA